MTVLYGLKRKYFYLSTNFIGAHSNYSWNTFIQFERTATCRQVSVGIIKNGRPPITIFSGTCFPYSKSNFAKTEIVFLVNSLTVKGSMKSNTLCGLFSGLKYVFIVHLPLNPNITWELYLR